ncbi:MAG: hypothetical protein ACKO6N_23485 [Myxococcota bacterium]
MQPWCEQQTELTAAVEAFMRAEDVREGDFEKLAVALVKLQCHTIPVVGRLAARQGWLATDPPPIWQWPAVPAQAYKHLDLYSRERPPKCIFTSSGTTAGSVLSRAPYSSEGLKLMDVSIEVNARRMLFGHGRFSRLMVMAPTPELAPGMIMAYGMQRLVQQFGLEGSQFLIGRDGFQLHTIIAQLEACEQGVVPYTWVGGSVAFARLLLTLEAQGRHFQLPPETRWMDAGGFKGRIEGLSLESYHEKLWISLGISPAQRVNLLGMTELPSQLYADTVAAQDEARSPLRGKRVPFWMRTYVLDPLTMMPTATGEPGLLLHYDLCNVERPFGVLTEDIGVAFADGSVEILGRAEGAALRGCALQLEQLTQPEGRG